MMLWEKLSSCIIWNVLLQETKSHDDLNAAILTIYLASLQNDTSAILLDIPETEACSHGKHN